MLRGGTHHAPTIVACVGLPAARLLRIRAGADGTATGKGDPLDRSLSTRRHHRQGDAHRAAESPGRAGVTVVIENKPGANSILGADIAAKAAADGTTFLTVIAAHAANATLYAGKLPFDREELHAGFARGIAPLIMTANNDFPVKDVKGLIEYAKANPGKISFGSTGIGAAAHLTTELFKQTAGVDMVTCPTRGRRRRCRT